MLCVFMVLVLVFFVFGIWGGGYVMGVWCKLWLNKG